MRQHRDLFLPTIVLDRISSVPLHTQICQQISEAIGSGAASHDARLPSTRTFARLLGVSRNTVLAAYDELAARDLIRGCTGSGMLVNATRTIPQPTLFSLRHVLRDAHYPARLLALTDPDGNPLYIRQP